MNKELAIKNFNEVLAYLDMNPKQLSEAVGKGRAQWAYDVLNPKKKVGISKNIAELICERFPKISKSWLLTGCGEMIINDERDDIKGFMKSMIDLMGKLEERTSKSIEEMEKQNRTLVEANAKLSERVLELSERILDLSQKGGAADANNAVRREALG